MKKILLLLNLLFTFFIAYSQKPAEDNSLLWKISGKDLKAPSYLFGTIHLICSDQYIWTDAMKNAFNNTKLLYLELPMADKGFQQEMMQHILLTDGKELKDFFTEEQYQKLDVFFKDSMKMQLTTFNKMKPFALMSFILLKYMDCNDKVTASYEEKLMFYAKEQNMNIKGLETFKEQMAIFDNMPDDTIAKMVMASFEDLNKNKTDFDKMTKAYTTQNINELYNLTLSSAEYASHLDAMLFQRNARWISLILSAAKEQPTFFGVGAGHLPGDKGVIALLRKQGYTVSPVK